MSDPVCVPVCPVLKNRGTQAHTSSVPEAHRGTQGARRHTEETAGQGVAVNQEPTEGIDEQLVAAVEARMAERLEAARRKREQQQVERRRRKRKRDAGLRARHAAKLRRSRGDG